MVSFHNKYTNCLRLLAPCVDGTFAVPEVVVTVAVDLAVHRRADEFVPAVVGKEKSF